MHEPIAPRARGALNRLAALVILVLLPSLVVFGWRALFVVGLIVGANVLSRALLDAPRTLDRRAARTWPMNALLLAALMPAETASGTLWPLLVGGGLLLALLERARRGWPHLPFDPAILAALALHLVACTAGLDLSPQASLQRNSIITGDVLRAAAASSDVEPWFKRPRVADEPAQKSAWAATALDDYLHGHSPTQQSLSPNMDALIRDRLPPPEDLVLLGHPMPLGQASGVFVLGVVLWGAYRRVTDWRVPIIAGIAAYAALIVLAVPTSITAQGRHWSFIAAARPDLGPATALTFAHYVIFASPMTLTLGLFAARLDTRPLRINAIVVWSVLLGIATAACTLYVSVAIGPLIALVFAPMLARFIDRVLARRPMRLPE